MEALNDADLRAAVAAECCELADVLDGLTDAEWDTPTLCSGWRVREVAAHMTMPVRYSSARFIFELVKARGKFNRMADRCARHDASLPTADLVSALRSEVMHAWTPPGGGHEGALIHSVVHGLDMTVPLGVERTVPETRIRVVLEGLAAPKTMKFFGAELAGSELRADDIDWQLGAGTPVAGRAQDLALFLAGRTLPAGRLRGGPFG